MTDYVSDRGRIDLRALEEPADPFQADRVIGAVMSRIAVSRDVAPLGVFAGLASYARPTLAAAAVLLAVAAGTVVVANMRAPDVEPTSALAAWTESLHVPTNAELLVAFQGYGQ